MKTKLLSLALCVMLALGALVPVSAAEPVYADGLSLKMIVEPQYNDARAMSPEGYAPVKIGDLWGIIDETGKLVVEAKYHAISAIGDGYAVAALPDPSVEPQFDWRGNPSYIYYQYIIDMNGNAQLIVEEDYDWDEERNVNVARVNSLRYYDSIEISNGLIQNIPSDRMQLVRTTANEKIDFDALGKAVADHINDHNGVRINSIYDGIVAYLTGFNPGGAFHADLNGNILRIFPQLTPGEYSHNGDWNMYLVKPDTPGVTEAWAPNDGLTMVSYGEYSNQFRWDTYYGVMDEEGKFVIEPKYNGFMSRDGQYFFNDVVVMSDENLKFGAIDRTGKVVVPFEYDELGVFSAGYAVAKKGGETFYIDTANNRCAVAGLDGGTATLSEFGSFGLNGVASVIDAAGNHYCIAAKPVNGVLPIVSGSALGMKLTAKENYVKVEKDGKFGFAKLDGAAVAEPEKPSIAPGTPMGDVLYTDIVAYIDGYAIRSYNINWNTYIVVEDLMEYGFGVTWLPDQLKLVVSPTRTATPDKYTTTYKPTANTQPTGAVAAQYLYTQITTWLGDKQVEGFNIGGYTCICMDDLNAFIGADYVWDAANHALRLTTRP